MGIAPYWMLRFIEFWLVYGWAFLTAAFLIGSIPFGLLVGRLFFKTDIRSSGSGNIGAANALRTMGRGAGISVLLLDAFKGAVATYLPLGGLHCRCVPLVQMRHEWINVSEDYGLSAQAPYAPWAVLCGMMALAAILGHCYSPWLRFRGGKGVATFLGVLCVAAWPSALAFIIVWLAIVLPTGFASLGSMIGALVSIAVVAKILGVWTLYFSIPALAIIVWKHRENIARLRAGTESRLDLLRRGNDRKAESSLNAPGGR
jgi:glycerol-3-phosphate acyltransferase PlsY